MVRPVRLQLSRRKGFNLQEVSFATNGLPARVVGRPSVWSNPFRIGGPSGFGFNDGGPKPLIGSLTRSQCIELFKTLMAGVQTPEMHPHSELWMDRFKERFGKWSHPASQVSELRGHNLACWCALCEACHAEVLLELSNGADT